MSKKEQELVTGLKAIHAAVRGDEKSECWTIRRWLDKRGVFNDDLGGTERLVEEVCNYLLAKVEGR